MPLYIAEHKHPASHCPAGNPQMAPFLLKVVSKPEAAKHGITIHGEAVVRGSHHLYLIVDAPSDAAVLEYLGPFAQVGSLQVHPASACEEVVRRGAC
jgi:uncharacterized protein DUF3303